MWLKARFEVVEVDRLLERVNSGEDANHLAAITFDDGHSSILELALPIVEELRVPVTLFVVPSLMEGATFWRDRLRQVLQLGLAEELWSCLDGPDGGLPPEGLYRWTKLPTVDSAAVARALERVAHTHGLPVPPESYASRAAIGAISSDIVTIGSHSMNHLVLASLQPEQQEEELVASGNYIRALGVRLSSLFAAPFGGLETVNAVTYSLARKAGYSGLLLSRGYTRGGNPRPGPNKEIARWMPSEGDIGRSARAALLIGR